MVTPKTPAWRRSRIRSAALVLVAMLAAVLAPTVVSAEPARRAPSVDDLQAQVDQLTTDIERLDVETSQLDEDFNEASLELAEINQALQENQGAVDEAQESHDVTEVEARNIVIDAYVGGVQSSDDDFAVLDVEMDAHRRTYLTAAHRDRSDVLDELRASRKTLGERQSELDGLKEDADAKAAQIREAKDRVTERIAERKALLDGANDELRSAVEAQREARAAAAAAAAQAEAESRATSQTSTSAAARTVRAPSGGGTATTTAAAPATPAPVAAPAPAPASGGAHAVQVALAQQGKPYRWAGSGPNSFDCSGLVMYAYAAAGRSLPHSSRSLRSMTRNIGAGQLQPGDLVFGGSPVHHVGIYIGNGQMVHAPNSGSVVKVSGMYSSSKPVSFGRL